MNQPHQQSSMQQQAVVQLQQSCQSLNLSNQSQSSPPLQLPRTVSNTSISKLASSSLSTVDCSYYQNFNTKKRRRRRNVQFASTSDLFMIPFKTSQDKQSTWYTKQDFINFKSDFRSCSKLMAESSCAESFESIAYSLATRTATRAMIHHLHPHDKIQTRGIEHTVSPTVLKLIAHRRKVVIRKVLREQARMREKPGITKQELDLRMIVELAQCSMNASLFAKDWAALKLLHD